MYQAYTIAIKWFLGAHLSIHGPTWAQVKAERHEEIEHKAKPIYQNEQAIKILLEYRIPENAVYHEWK